jgi:predicted acetyltransferase
LVKINEKYAGFALVRKIIHEDKDNKFHYSMAEFFILKKYRKSGVGKQTAFHLFDLFPGTWEVAEIKENIPAQKFWRKIISEYTNDNYKEIQKDDWEGPIQSFCL